MDIEKEFTKNHLCHFQDGEAFLKSKLKTLSENSSSQFSVKLIELTALQKKVTAQLLNRYLSPEEKNQYKISQTPLNFLAKRIAAKTAFFEIYTGDARLKCNQITIAHDEKGAPYFCVHGRLKGYSLSISDESNLVAVICSLSSYKLQITN